MFPIQIYQTNGYQQTISVSGDQILLPILTAQIPHHDFVFSGKLLRGQETVNSLEMDPYDIIDAFPRNVSVSPPEHKRKFLQHLRSIGWI